MILTRYDRSSKLHVSFRKTRHLSHFFRGSLSARRRFPWSPQAEMLEDWYICTTADIMFDSLPRDQQPAPRDEATRFAVETIFYDKPFGIHKFWEPGFYGVSPHTPGINQMFNRCPEVWAILPPFFRQNEEWKAVLCSIDVSSLHFDITRNTTIDLTEMCLPTA